MVRRGLKIISIRRKEVLEDTLKLTNDLLDFNGDTADDTDFEFPCKVCHKVTTVECEPEEFKIEYHYCGGSPRVARRCNS